MTLLLLIKQVRHYVIVCQIHKYILTCINMVITCQTVEFGRATTVLGITMLCKLLTGKTGCWQCFSKHRDSLLCHNQKWRSWIGYLMLWVSAALVRLTALSNVYLFLSMRQIFCHINFQPQVNKTALKIIRYKNLSQSQSRLYNHQNTFASPASIPSTK